MATLTAKLTRRAKPASKTTAGAPREFLLAPFGFVQVDGARAGKSFYFDQGRARQAVEAFHALGRDLAVDYEHQTVPQFNTRRDGLSPAAGWIPRLEVRGDGLWAAGVRWTDQAEQLIASREYRYLSPVIYWTDETHSAVAGLGPVALTNEPAIRGSRPLLAASRGWKGTSMHMTVCSAQPLPTGGGRTGVGTPTKHPYLREIDAVVASQGCSKLQAIQTIGQQKPELLESYKRSQTGAGGQPVVGKTAPSPKHPYLREIDAVVASRGCTKLDAIGIVKRTRPTLFASYCSRSQTPTPAAPQSSQHPFVAAVARTMARAGCSVREAVRAAKREQPALYASYYNTLF